MPDIITVASLVTEAEDVTDGLIFTCGTVEVTVLSLRGPTEPETTEVVVFVVEVVVEVTTKVSVATET